MNLDRNALAGIVATIAVAVTGSPSVRASIVRTPVAAAGEMALTVRLHPSEVTLGSYQGTLRYTPGAFSIVSATAPKGDGTRVVNVADSAKGLVRFAGFTVSGFATMEVLTIVVRPARALETAGLAADIEVAGDLNGVSVPRDRLVPARGISPDSGRK